MEAGRGWTKLAANWETLDMPAAILEALDKSRLLRVRQWEPAGVGRL